MIKKVFRTVVGSIWTMDIGPGSIFDQSIYFHRINILIPPFLQHQFCLRDHYIVCMYTCELASLCVRSSEVRFGQHNKTSTGNCVNLFLLRSTTCKFSIDYNRNSHITVYKYIIVIISHRRVFTGIKFGIFIAWRYYVNHFGKLWFHGHRHSICCLYVLILKGKIQRWKF